MKKFLKIKKTISFPKNHSFNILPIKYSFKLNFVKCTEKKKFFYSTQKNKEMENQQTVTKESIDEMLEEAESKKENSKKKIEAWIYLFMGIAVGIYSTIKKYKTKQQKKIETIFEKEFKIEEYNSKVKKKKFGWGKKLNRIFFFLTVNSFIFD